MMENLTLSEFQKVKKSKFGWNFNIMDGLGWILKIFKQNHQKRPEAKVNLRNNDQRLEQPPVVQMAWKLCHYGDAILNLQCYISPKLRGNPTFCQRDILPNPHFYPNNQGKHTIYPYFIIYQYKLPRLLSKIIQFAQFKHL